MLFKRIIPVLLLRRRSLVKSVKFRNPTYVGDPINTVRIFNEREVDELIIVDINASPEHEDPNYDLIEEIAAEAFMPFAYGGGVSSVEHARELFRRGAEKVVVNTAACRDPELVSRLASAFGSQSVVASIDCKRKWQGGWRVLTCHGREKTAWEPEAWAVELEKRGAGEIMLTSIDQDGTFKGYDVELTRTVVNAVDLPVIACGGAGNLEHVNQALNDGGAMAAGAGSLFVFQGSNRSVLVNYPGRGKLDALLK